MQTIQHTVSRCSAFALTLLLGTALVLTGCDSGLSGPDLSKTTGDLSALTSAKGGNSGPFVGGSGHLTVDEAFRTFSFHARQKKDGEFEGLFNLQARQTPARLRGTVDCFQIIGENQAVVAGFITDAGESGFREGGNFAFFVEDNGEGSAATDALTLIPQFTVPQPGFPDDQSVVDFFCTAPGGGVAALPPLRPIEAGNIQVKP